MNVKNKSVIVVLAVILLATLACGLPGGGAPSGGEETGGGPTQQPAPTQQLAPTQQPATEAPPSAGELSQWASTAIASSEYSTPDWSAQQATGAPNTQECGDFETAWASEASDGVDWLEVGFETPVVPTRIDIRETNAPGSIVEVEVKDEAGQYYKVWQGEPGVVAQCPRVFAVPVSGVPAKVVAVRIHLDQRESDTWNEIDAVQLVGQP
jgi:hypothetical protein